MQLFDILISCDRINGYGFHFFCGRYLSKGRQIVVEGRISTRKWKDEKTGQNRKAVEVVASNIYFADSNGGNANGNSQPANNDGFMDVPDDGQLPFN